MPNKTQNTIIEPSNTAAQKNKASAEKKARAFTALKISAVVILTALLVLLLINAFMSVFSPHYYPTFGKTRFFSVVTDSMEPEIKAGSMIKSVVPKSADDIKVGDVVTYEYVENGSKTLITHRVQQIETVKGGTITYTMKGDNVPIPDGVHPEFSEIIGVYTGKSVGFLGYVAAFMQSAQGAITLIVIIFIVLAACIIIHYVKVIKAQKTITLAAIKKCGELLPKNKKEFDSIRTVMDIVSTDPTDDDDRKASDAQLGEFIATGKIERKNEYADLIPDHLAKIEHVQVTDELLGDTKTANNQTVKKPSNSVRATKTRTAKKSTNLKQPPL